MSFGYVHIEALLSSSDCSTILEAAADEKRFERRVDMAPKGYGVGTYYYFREALSEPAAALRSALYERLRPFANNAGIGAREPYPPTLHAFWRRCRRAGQERSSSIILCYGSGGLNHPHRDIYGKFSSRTKCWLCSASGVEISMAESSFCWTKCRTVKFGRWRSREGIWSSLLPGSASQPKPASDERSGFAMGCDW